MKTQLTNPLVKYIFFAIPATVLLIFPSYSDPINFPKLVALCLLTVTNMILATFLRNKNLFRTASKRDKFVLSIYGLLFTLMLISGLLGSQNEIRIWFGTFGRNNGLLYFLSVIGLAMLTYKVAIGTREIKYLNRLLSWTSIAFGSYCLVQLMYLDPISWNSSYNRVIGFLGNPNFSASALAIFSIFWGYEFLRISLRSETKSNKDRLIALISCLTFSLLSFATQSLQGVVLLALGFGTLIIIYVNQSFRSKWIIRFLIAGGFAASVLAFVSFLGFGPLGNQLEQYTLRLRGWYAYFGYKSMLENPLMGVGVDNYIIAFRKYRTIEFVQQYGNSLSSNNAHSIPLQIGSNFGLPVFILYCILQSVILFRSMKLIFSRAEDLSYVRGIAVLWVLVFAQSLLSIEIIGLGVMNWILGAVVLGAKPMTAVSDIQSATKNSSKMVSRESPDLLGTLAVVSVTLLSIPVVIIGREDVAFQNISKTTITNQESKEWIEQNFRKLSNFTLLDPAKVNKILPKLYASGLDAEATKLTHELFKIEPKDAYVNDLLATMYQNMNQFEQEIEVRERMRELSPLDYRLEGILARAYYDQRAIQKLVVSVGRLKSIAPESEDYWKAKAQLEELRKDS